MLIFLLLLASSLFSEWTPQYDPHFFRYCQKEKRTTAVCVVAFNRPEYLARLIQSIEKNEESQTLPFFFFIDGGPNGKQREMAQLIGHSNIADKYLFLRELNYGCPKNHIDSKRFLFDWCGFDRIVVMEEDLEISKDYFKTLFHFDEWANARYANVGTVQLWANDCKLSKKEKAERQAQVKNVRYWWSLVTYCLHKDVWDRISPFLYTFEKNYIDPLLGFDEYGRMRSKPGSGIYNKPIRDWVKQVISDHDHDQILRSWGREKLVLNSLTNIGAIGAASKDNFRPNQDCMTALAIWLGGYVRLQTVVNRVAHIGLEGITNPNGIRKETVVLHELPFDGEISRFVNVTEKDMLFK